MATYSSWFKKDVGLITDTMVLNKVFGNQYATQTDFRKVLFIVKLSKANFYWNLFYGRKFKKYKSNQHVVTKNYGYLSRLIERNNVKLLSNMINFEK